MIRELRFLVFVCVAILPVILASFLPPMPQPLGREVAGGSMIVMCVLLAQLAYLVLSDRLN